MLELYDCRLKNQAIRSHVSTALKLPGKSFVLQQAVNGKRSAGSEEPSNVTNRVMGV